MKVCQFKSVLEEKVQSLSTCSFFYLLIFWVEDAFLENGFVLNNSKKYALNNSTDVFFGMRFINFS